MHILFQELKQLLLIFVYNLKGKILINMLTKHVEGNT
jgi:hypothetical protein